jgi:hypothetical protein
MEDIDYDGSSYIVVASVSSTPYVFQSTDLVNWTNITSSVPFPANNFAPRGIAYGNGTWSIIAYYNTILYSTDGGTTWSAGTGIANNSFPRIMAYENGIFFAGGDNGYVHTSNDGQTFTALPRLGTQDFFDIVYGNGIWIMVAARGTIAVSADGTNWSLVNNPFLYSADYNFVGVGYGNGLFYAMGSGTGLTNTIYYSLDGTNWSAELTPATGIVRDAAYSNNTWLLSASDGELLRTGTVDAEIISNNSSLVIPPGNTSAKLLKRANNSWLANIEYTQSIEDSNTISSIMGVY